MFIDDLKLIYTEVVEGNKPNLEYFKDKWQINEGIGEAYQSLCKKEHKKELGSFYTPLEVVRYMVDDIVKDINYEENPNIKILDPSCGGGYFLIELYKKLVIKAEKLGIDNPEDHVMNINLYGFDIDENAIMISQIEIYEKTGHTASNIECRDFLIGLQEEYDIIIGNPPYMGHKMVTGEYRKKISEEYRAVFSDKGDLSYCFIKRGIDSLKNSGRLVFLTSRYILEALNASDIRRYIISRGSLISIVDFYGVRIIKGVGVDNIILKFEKSEGIEELDFFRVKSIAKGMGEEVFNDISRNKERYVKHVNINISNLKDEGWSFLNSMEISIINKINGYELSTFCESFQGIITGCDDAFVITEEEANRLNIERELLKPWIKNKNVREYRVSQPEELLIYSDLIKEEKVYKNAIDYIERYRGRLEGRRECVKGMRRWYELQWGRKPDIFEGSKIIYPYKASKNRFALDRGNYFSADVYAIRIKEMFINTISYEFLTGILNSSIYEFYIKTIAKKLGDDLYDYYPNKIMTLRIPENIMPVEQEVLNPGNSTRYNIDMILLDHFGMNLDEYSIIRSWCL
ncbi:MAG: class SAM-dependent methyltransferase [Clostridiales bacterium]|nr:class SAM-dependent methyltransferase [Clostridiales bacterium]